MSSALSRRPARRVCRLLGWILSGIGLLLLTAVAGLWSALGKLDQPRVRAPLCAWIERQTGLGLEYAVFDLAPTSGLSLEGLRLRTPAAYARFAEHLLAIDRLRLDWRASDFLAGEVRLQALELHGLRVSLVDEGGTDGSLPRLLAVLAEHAEPEAVPPEPTVPARPLSRTLVEGLPAVAVDRLVVDGLSFEWQEVSGELVTRRLTLDGLGLSGSLDLIAKPPKLALALGSAAGEDGLRLVQQTIGEGVTVRREAVLALEQRLTSPASDALDSELRLALVRQDLEPALRLPPSLAELRLGLRFEPEAGVVRLACDRLDLLAGAVTGSLAAARSDDGSLRLERAELKLDGARLQAALPPEAVPLELPGARMALEATGLEIDPKSGLPVAGAARLEAAADRVVAGGLTLERPEFQARLQAGPERTIELSGSGRLAGLTRPETGLTVGGLTAAWEGRSLRLDPAEPARWQGHLETTGRLDEAELALGDRRLRIEAAGWRLATDGTGALPLSVAGELPLGSLRLLGPGARDGLELSGLRLSWKLLEFTPDFSSPARLSLGLSVARARVRQAGLDLRADGAGVELQLGGLNLPAGDVRRASGQLELQARLPAARLSSAGGLRTTGLRLELSAGVLDGQPGALSGSLELAGLERAGAGLLEQARLGWQTRSLALDLERPERSSADLELSLSARRVAPRTGAAFALAPSRLLLSARRGTSLAADVRLLLRELVAEGSPVDGELAVEARGRLERAGPAADWTIGLKGPEGLTAEVALKGQFDRSTTELAFEARSQLSHLGLLGRLLPELAGGARLSWGELELHGNSAGRWRGLVTGFAGWAPVLAGDPLRAARGRQTFDLALSGLTWSSGESRLSLPGLGLRFDLERGEGALRGSADLQVERARLTLASGGLELQGLQSSLKLKADDEPASGTLDFEVDLGLGSLRQEWFAEYPVRDASLKLEGSLSRLQALRVKSLELLNPAGGTRLSLELALDRLARLAGPVSGGEESAGGSMPGRQALALTATLEQDLARLALGEDGPRLAGKLRLPLRVESGDLSAFRLQSALEAEGVSVDWPAQRLTIAGLDGRIPVVEEVALLPDGGLEPVLGSGVDPYSRARFLDVHPFLRGDHFLALQRLALGDLELGPLAGNLRVERELLSLDQLQLGLAGGLVTGQLALLADPQDPRLFFKGNVTGLRPGGSEDVLDANATLTLAPARLDLSGRVQVVRIGRDHLLALLDRLDPYRENTGINRVRLALKVGYPKTLRLQLAEGFLNAKVELGGAVDFVRIDEIRGVALGPLLDRYVAPQLRALGWPRRRAPTQPAAAAAPPNGGGGE